MNGKILVVDDEIETLNSLKAFLEFNDYEVEIALSAKDALALMETNKFSIALLDISMPEVSGIELLQKIKHLDFSVQVIMMTAYTSFDRTLTSLQSGAIDYILKPIKDMDNLLQLIRESYKRVERWKKALRDAASQ